MNARDDGAMRAAKENQMSTEPLLSVQGLAVDFATMDGVVHAVEGVDLEIRPGETVAIVGESGSGKSTTAMAIIGLLAGGGKIAAGSIRLDGKEISRASEHELRAIRGRDIGLVPQDPMSNLNPVAKIGTQVAETLLAHGLATRQNVQAKVVEALTAAGLPDPARRAKQYPHEFSGGMRQRALIAIGLACKPRLLIADEPTSALDVTVQQTILDQIGQMTRELGTAVLLITHDLGLAAERAERVIVMHRGKVVEQGDARQILEDPQHPYTQSLVKAAPSVAAARLQPEAFRVQDRPAEVDPAAPVAPADNIVEIENLTKVYPVRGRGEDFVAVDDVSLVIPRGETVAIVGESGSGKTTTARMLLKVIEPTKGLIRYEGKDISTLSRAETRNFRQQVQPIFQDPYSSLNPMFTIERLIAEPLEFYKRGSGADRRTRVRQLLDDVALPQSMLRRYPSELSGGQRQRVAIARALALSPDLIVCDEPVSALDVLVQDQILKLLGDLQREYGLSYLFISHDLAVVRLISDYVCVMKDGKLVEAATSEEIFTNPRDPYTRRLLASIPGNELGIAS
ncbi:MULTISPECIES: ABC transporter ATP-binding protein [unclassified Microbacterium]|uniref:ABC transporter ATP-binding protein n=1 Tax=unclassified Microbacterium TaxID=2609290 RepID=UPI000CFBA807|nr:MULTISPECIES: ABC transporter ATP-binding protein [unclassified Microbacterium]PQZ55089.1 ABC transporter ATP-binding protein [Microbacterium sp. MYb43]PQZ81467.1 ABC transporter ATP-binding protein [Microbacterium sp. MYb40]PRB21449.1 ABC transporter ATP-binding protein [Microbacterium sp. MYb54]PRB30014.1 ABC transporter ATP-binding protein [Microbacterium sp. MYb50]PRB67828.1 ABC transporter ATP-binding protein [Microbacterium sp. MYb24]